MSYIYGLVDPRSSEVRYVGYTSGTPEGRLRDHLNCARRGLRAPRCCWIRSLLAEELRPEIVVLERNPLAWEGAESSWIVTLRNLGCRLMNATPGGEVGSLGGGWRLTEETKAKMRKPKSAETRKRMSEARRANPRPPMSAETRAKISAARLGKPLSEAHRKALSVATRGKKNGMYGRTHSEEARAKMGSDRTGAKNSFYGKRHTPEAIEKIRQARLAPGRKALS